MRIVRILYWLVVGAMLGFGYLAVLSIGLPFIIVGAILVAVGVARCGARDIWAGLVGFGGFPAIFLTWTLVSSPWACDTGVVTGGSGSPDNVAYYSCVNTPFGLLTTSHILAAVSAIIALVGPAWPLIATAVRQARRPANT